MPREQHHSPCHGREVSAVRERPPQNPALLAVPRRARRQLPPAGGGQCPGTDARAALGQGSQNELSVPWTETRSSVMGSCGWRWLGLNHVKDSPPGWGWGFVCRNRELRLCWGEGRCSPKRLLIPARTCKQISSSH